MSDSLIRSEILDSEEIVTEFTLAAERQTEHLTGISINQRITERELRLRGGDCQGMESTDLCRQIHLYRQYIQMLERTGDLADGSIKEIECFWPIMCCVRRIIIYGCWNKVDMQK